MAQFGLVQNLVIRWHHLHCLQSWPPGCITALPHCLELPYWHYQLVLSWYLHQPESHQLSLHKVSYSLTSGPKDPKHTWKILKNVHGHFYRTQVNLGSDLWVRMSLRPTPCVDLTDVTLADEDTNSILTDNANRIIQGNVAIQVTQP